jgi:hypothetical protein
MPSFRLSYCWVPALLAALSLSFSTGPVHAQFGQDGNQGNQGGSGTGNQGTGGTGNQGSGNQGGGSGNGGSTNVDGGSPGEMGGSLSGPTFLQIGSDIDVTGGTGFVGRGNPAQNFVGGTLQTGQGQTPGGGRFGQVLQGMDRQGGGNQQFRQQPTGPSRAEQVRPRHRVSFAYTPRQNEATAGIVQARLGQPNSPIAGVAVSLDGEGVATLSGTAATQHDSRLAAALARLEPGVRGVRNQLTVAEGE